MLSFVTFCVRSSSSSAIRSALGFWIGLFALPSIAQHAPFTPLNDLLGNDFVSLNGFIDTDVAYDFNDFRPRSRTYLTQPSRDREAQINLAFVDAKLSTENVRGRLALQGGSSVDVNYSAEPEQGVRYIQEGSLGYALSNDLWIDAGIYSSHIGAESFISRDNWSYTRLLASEFSPYYQSGAKLSYSASSALTFQLHFINGWQNASEFNGRNALGTQVAYQWDNGVTLTHNTFVGKEAEGTRFFNDIVIKSPLVGAFEFAGLIDIGDQQRISGNHDQWYSWALLARYTVDDALKWSARVEQYLDPENVIVSTPNSTGFKTIGGSVGVDYEIAPALWWRTEYRAFIGESRLFPSKRSSTKRSDQFVVTSLSYSF